MPVTWRAADTESIHSIVTSICSVMFSDDFFVQPAAPPATKVAVLNPHPPRTSAADAAAAAAAAAARAGPHPDAPPWFVQFCTDAIAAPRPPTQTQSPALHAFTIRQLCPFGLNWHGQPIGVDDRDLDASLSSIHRERCGLQMLGRELLSSGRGSALSSFAERAARRLKALQKMEAVLEEGARCLQPVVNAWMADAAPPEPDMRSTAQLLLDDGAILTRRLQEEQRRRRERTSAAMRPDVREYYAGLLRSFDEDAVVSAWMSNATPLRPSSAEFPRSRVARASGGKLPPLELESAFFTDEVPRGDTASSIVAGVVCWGARGCGLG